MSKPLIIYGNGAMAKVLHAYLKDTHDIKGFCVDKCCIEQSEFLGLPLVDFADVEKIFPPKTHDMINSVGFAQMNDLRKQKCQEAQNKGYNLISYVHPSVKIFDDVKIGKNCIILDFVSIHPGSVIEDGTFISSNVNIGHDCTIGAYSWINSGVSIAGNVTIGGGCFWGVNSCCADNISVGEYTYVGANTLVVKPTAHGEVLISSGGEKFKLSSHNFLKFIGG